MKTETTTPRAPRAKAKRRTADEIARDAKMQTAASQQIGRLIHKQWEHITEASGPITITLDIDHEAGLAKAKIEFERSVEIEADMALDDGQQELLPNSNEEAKEKLAPKGAV